jgi:hypothetical protein
VEDGTLKSKEVKYIENMLAVTFKGTSELLKRYEVCGNFIDEL